MGQAQGRSGRAVGAGRTTRERTGRCVAEAPLAISGYVLEHPGCPQSTSSGYPRDSSSVSIPLPVVKKGAAMSAPTIRDVARAARVSPTTVSNLLNERSARMQAATRERVLQVIRELGYQPSRVARQLRTGRGHQIGLVVPSVANPFWGGFTQVLEAEALLHGYQVLICNSQRDPERERAYLEELDASGTAAVVLGSSLPSLDYLGSARARGLRLITLDRQAQPDDPPLVGITVDNRLGALLAVRHLTSLEHKRIAFVSGAITTVGRRARFAGYREGLEEAGISFREELVWSPSDDRHYGDAESAELGKLAIVQLLDLPSPPTAIMTINDMYAIGAIAGARGLGLVVPDEISVVGFDDITLASFFQPPLTTVAQPLVEMARATIKLVLDDRDSWHDGTRSSIVVAPRLVVRASSSPPASDPRKKPGPKKVRFRPKTAVEAAVT
jgi:DNA-binding LacI/PurR family transcriptional regulator